MACIVRTKLAPGRARNPIVGAILLAACGLPSRAAAVPCPRLPLIVPAGSTDAAPSYTREMWLADSLATADLVVLGAAEESPPRIRVTRVLCGSIHRSLRERRTVRALSTRLAAGAGVFLLVRTPIGYLSLNPDPQPLPLSEWQAIAARASPAPRAPALAEHASEAQIYRTLRGAPNVWHGVEVYVHEGDHVSVTLHERGARIAMRSFGWDGALSLVERRTRSGRGFSLAQRRGQLASYVHYQDGRIEGLAQGFRDGRLEREARYRAGLCVGAARAWNEQGQLEWDVVYRDGLEEPIAVPPVAPTFRRDPDGDGGGEYAAAGGRARLAINVDDEHGCTPYYSADDIVNRLRVGMTVQEVAAEIGLPVSVNGILRFSAAGPCQRRPAFELVRGRIAALRWEESSETCHPW